MAKFNLYKIAAGQKDTLVIKLKSVGLTNTGSKTIDGFTLDFYFSNKPDEIDIWWAHVYKDFFGGIELPKNQIYFSTLLVYNPSITYAISLGKSHFYLKTFCDLDFGLNLAERIIDESNLKIKNSKFYKSRKNKIITTYQDGSGIDFDSGESMHYIKAKTVDATVWGKTASFGHSAQFSIEMTPDELPGFVNNIEETLNQPTKIKLPKVVMVQDPQKAQGLDGILANALIPAGDGTSGVNVDDISLSGIDFIFSDHYQYSIYIRGARDSHTQKGELTIEKLREFIVDNSINLKEQIDFIKVKVHNELGRNFSKPIKEFLDFVDEKDRFCLIDGKWYQFNQSYIDFLRSEVDKIETVKMETVSETEEVDFNKRMANDGYINCDRVIDTIDKKYKVEHLDLYKDGALIFVKIGSPKKMNYNIDQAINVVKLLQNNQSRIKINDEAKKVNTICLWLIFDRRTPIEKLSDSRSLIFHMKLVDWKKTVLNAGYKPIVYISQRRENPEKTSPRKIN
ncbi:DUF6119 family protein [Candidatus Manganitrophus noduliformans]|uniref:Sporadically distributed protein, TIGR04141 family n=1 Tax=Candidatus Manganitrophus noduliformans TaxID=2606439 RepID=A0A7X6ICX5_9BACT|nr:DUF6119 family protein [Candidatus Manganitrophus noduliformans]NKE72985.1 hypothetical protein [Candidatus Manganitrophus noduliformans]